jgi:arabinofuranan 3-O-arabinosyltransferase
MRPARPQRQGDDLLGSWLRARASWPALGAAAVLLAVSVQSAVRTAGSGVDNRVVVTAARTFLDGGAPYGNKRFLYLPSSVLLAVPEARLSDGVLRYAAPLAAALAVLLGWWISLRIFDVPARSRLAVGVAGGLAYFAPFRGELYLANWTAVSAAALPLSLALAARGRWTAAAAVAGAAMAVKPMLVPLALLFVFARRWRALGVLFAVPLAASVLAETAMTNPALLFSKTLPFLLRGQDAYARPYDASLTSVLPRLGVAQPAAALLAASLAAAGVWAAWCRWRGGGDERLRLVDTASMLMLATFVVARPAFLHYVLVVLPVLLASLPIRASVARSPWFWIVLLPQNTAVPWPYLATADRRAFKDALMLSGLAAVLAWRSVTGQRPRGIPGGVTGTGAGPAARDRAAVGGGPALPPTRPPTRQ